jgi:hypothetical protein
MSELVKPLIRAWNYIEQVGGYPGQLFFVVAVIMLIIGLLTWVGNRK